MSAAPVREQLLEETRRLLMTRGYNAFSYRDLARTVGVKTSSIHYYFPAKEDLARAAVEAYSTDVLAIVRAIDPAATPAQRLERYAKAYAALTQGGGRVCLCGMLAADIESLPEAVRAPVRSFFEANEAWLASVLAEGQKDGTLRVRGSARGGARALFSALQGAGLANRLFQSATRIDDIVNAFKA